jgi:hypothetical protein
MGIFDKLLKEKKVKKDKPNNTTLRKPLLIMISSAGPPLSLEEANELIEQCRFNVLIDAAGGARIRTFSSPEIELTGLWAEMEEIAKEVDSKKREQMEAVAMVLVHSPEYDPMRIKHVKVKHPKTGVECRVIICSDDFKRNGDLNKIVEESRKMHNYIDKLLKKL